jgi:hypothetical protein
MCEGMHREATRRLDESLGGPSGTLVRHPDAPSQKDRAALPFCPAVDGPCARPVTTRHGSFAAR